MQRLRSLKSRAPFSPVRGHLATHWQHHALLWGIILSVASFTLGGAAGYAYVARGGYHPGPLPPPITVSPLAGGTLPAHHSLGRWVVRVHNQGSSNSCVGQTLATITEITRFKHSRHRRAFSSGFIYDQSNNGRDQGSSYQAAFSILTSEGDARLAVFPHDGIDWWVHATPGALADARHFRVRSWRSIAPSDRYTISYEIAHGRPVAIAIPVTDAFYNHWNERHVQTVSSQYGAFHFFHSVTAIAYNQTGVTILNSWGPLYGRQGRIRLSWSFLRQVNAAVVVSHPLFPLDKTAGHEKGHDHELTRGSARPALVPHLHPLLLRHGPLGRPIGSMQSPPTDN